MPRKIQKKSDNRVMINWKSIVRTMEPINANTATGRHVVIVDATFRKSAFAEDIKEAIFSVLSPISGTTAPTSIPRKISCRVAELTKAPKKFRGLFRSGYQGC